MFELHPQLAADTVFVADLPVCRVLLMKNALFPWLLLVPARPNIRELFDLSPADYETAMREVREVTIRFAKLTGGYKMNVATLGNVTPQMHIHIIARFKDDAAWPMPVWNCTKQAKFYSEQAQESMSAKVLGAIADLLPA
jgi:diadenosine tetraphosphate (Ap4A) HIT family hydrolase